MKQKLILAMLIFMVLAAACATYAQTDEVETTYHWMLENTDDAYILCADGNFVVEVNGHDSLHVICQPQGESK